MQVYFPYSPELLSICEKNLITAWPRHEAPPDPNEIVVFVDTNEYSPIKAMPERIVTRHLGNKEDLVALCLLPDRRSRLVYTQLIGASTYTIDRATDKHHIIKSSSR